MIGRTNAIGGSKWKYASGTLSLSGEYDTVVRATVSGLGFKPRVVIAAFGRTNVSVGVLNEDDVLVFDAFLSTIHAEYGVRPSWGSSEFSSNDNGFSLKIIKSAGTANWYAWGY